MNEVAELLHNLALEAQRGRVTDVLVVARGEDGSYADCYLCDDLQEMLLEVGNAKIRARVEAAQHDRQTTQ
jgi:hypothetical protein